MDWILFIGIFTSFWMGASHMNKLMENPDTNIPQLNLGFALWGCLFGGLSLLDLGALSVLFAFLMGVFFGLIGVNYMFEKRNK